MCLLIWVMGVLSSTSWFIINLFSYFFFVVVSAAGHKSMTKCIEKLSLPIINMSFKCCYRWHRFQPILSPPNRITHNALPPWLQAPLLKYLQKYSVYSGTKTRY
jgi:hypothetical protein